MERTAEIHIPHWVSLFSRKGRSWCSTSHLGSDRFGSLCCWRGLRATSLALGIPGDNVLCSPGLIDPGTPCTDGSANGQEADPKEENSRPSRHPWEMPVGWGVFGVHLPLC